VLYHRFAQKLRIFDLYKCKSAYYLLSRIDLMHISDLIFNLQQVVLQV
jgi:hypothetical protein